MIEGSGSGSIPLMYPDPGGPKTCGSGGSGTLKTNVQLFFLSPRMHVFGHIHEAYGIHVEQNILFINAACLGELELIQHEPVVVGKCERTREEGRANAFILSP
jgi:hypothetical protein